MAHLSRISWFAVSAVLTPLPPAVLAQAEGDESPRHYTRTKSFDLPVRIPEEIRAALSEIRLYVKGPNTPWALQEKAGSDVRFFSCKVREDGEYLYTLVTVDKSGKQNPADVSAEPPNQRVVVDTTPPVIAVKQWKADGKIGLRCTVEDANPDPATLKAVCRTADGEVALEAVPNQPGVFQFKDAAQAKLPVAVSVMDRAKNKAVKEVKLDDMPAVQEKETPAAGPAPTKPAAKEQPKQDIDAVAASAFGKDSAESKRPIRVLLSDIGMVIAAENMSVDVNGRACFTSASIGLVKGDSEIGVLRGEEIVVRADQPIGKLADLPLRRIASVEVRGKVWTTVLTPKELPQTSGPQPKPFPMVPGKEGGSEEVAAQPVRPVAAQPVRPVAAQPVRPVDLHFEFKVDPKTPVADLLPTPVNAGPAPSWANEDLTKVAELTLGAQIAKSLTKHQATQATAHAIAKVNHLNAKKKDGFLLAMLDQRPELRGLPFLMGDECRTREEQARMFTHLADAVNKAIGKAKALEEKNVAGESLDKFWAEIISEMQGVNTVDPKTSTFRLSAVQRDQANRAAVAALTQILMPESEHYRLGLAKCLATIPHIDATRVLARLAVFSPEDEVRAAAIEGLRLRREKDYTEILMQGFTYPLPAVSKRAAEAIVKLERKDLLPNLVAVLESPDPRMPVKRKEAGKEVAVVRELVKINHHKNCLLCHAPGNTDNTPEGVLKVAVPLPGEPLPKPSEGGYQSTPSPTPDILVRIDMTYLRQDFSMMMPVSDAHTWPDMQRFDFLVRTRTLTAAEAQAYEPCCEEEEPGRLSPYHRAALYALRELTGRDTEPTAAAWRKLLKLPK